MDFPSTRPNIKKQQSYKPNFGKSSINNLIRLSANESALGASLNAIEALKSFSNNINRYPPQVSDELISAISRRYLLDKKKIIIGNIFISDLTGKHTKKKNNNFINIFFIFF